MSEKQIAVADLQEAYEGSYYTILGCGGDLQEWIEGYEEMLANGGIGTPIRWLQTTGERINNFAVHAGSGAPDGVDFRNWFQPSLVLLMFSLEGLDVSKLAMFKLVWGDRWFDYIIDNMRM